MQLWRQMRVLGQATQRATWKVLSSPWKAHLSMCEFAKRGLDTPISPKNIADTFRDFTLLILYTKGLSAAVVPKGLLTASISKGFTSIIMIPAEILASNPIKVHALFPAIMLAVYGFDALAMRTYYITHALLCENYDSPPKWARLTATVFIISIIYVAFVAISLLEK